MRTMQIDAQIRQPREPQEGNALLIAAVVAILPQDCNEAFRVILLWDLLQLVRLKRTFSNRGYD